MNKKQQAEMALDVREEFEAVLSDTKTNFQAAFSFNKSYPDAPNPALKLSDLGIVGLPLSTRDAEAIKSRSVQAPFGKGERTVVDKNVRDTWEIDAKLVSFSNPKWNSFVAQAVGEVCGMLGVNIKASKPRAELYKLLLYETGSHFLPHVDTEKANGMFATIVIVLPSHFTGGAAHLSFGDLSTVYDCSGNSQLDTTVLAWYTDVTHEIKPITSGFRLALSYNLVHTTQALRPALATHSGVTSQLARVLSAWRDDASGPEKLLYMLDHRYSEAGLRASALKGADAQRVALLDVLARKHGFRLGLANAHCHLSGTADDDFGYRRGRRDWWDDEDEDDDDADVDFGEIEDREMTIKHLVNLEGELLAKKLEYDEDCETIPADLTDTVESGPCDKQDYEGYQGNGAGSLERWYRRTVLVIWPARNNATVLDGRDPAFDRAVEELSGLTATDERARELADFVLANYMSGPAKAAQEVCKVAVEQDDAALWTRVVAACAKTEGVAVVEDEVWMEALECWGWNAVRPSFEVMLEGECGNAARLAFLGSLRGEPWDSLASDEDKVRALQEEMRPWAEAQVQQVLRTLRKPTADECPVLLEAACKNGGITFLNDVMLPQLVSVTSEDVLRELAAQLFASDAFPDSPEKSTVISALLGTAIASAAFFASVPPPPRLEYSWRLPQPAPQPPAPAVDHAALAKRYVQTCIVLGCPDLVGAVLDRAGDTAALAPPHAQECARTVMLPLVAACAERMRETPESVPKEKLEGLRKKAVGLYLEWFATKKDSFTKFDVAGLIEAVFVDGDASMLIETVVPRLEALALSETSLRALVDELRCQKARFTFPEGYAGRTPDAVLSSLVQRFIAASVPHSAAVLAATLDWLLTLGVPAFWQSAVVHYAAPRHANAQFTHTASWLAPALRQWGVAHGVLEQLGPAFQALMKTWRKHVLGTGPAPHVDTKLMARVQGLAKWTCTCGYCKPAKTFLTSNPQKVMELHRIGAPNRRHVEGYLSSYASDIASYVVVRTTPQGLRITKSDALCRLLGWTTQQATGKGLLRSISTDNDELKRLLGAEYNNIVSALRGDPIPASKTTTPATAGSHTGGPSGSTAPSVAGRGPVAPNPASRTAPVMPLPPPPQAHYPVPAASAARHPALIPTYKVPSHLPTHSTATLPGQAGAGPSATAALLQQVQPPLNAVATLKRGVKSAAAPNATAGSSTATGAGVSSEPPAKKRKMQPVNEDDVIDLT